MKETRFLNVLASLNGFIIKRIVVLFYVKYIASGTLKSIYENRENIFKEKYKFFGMCCLSVWHAALRRQSKDWLARNQNNVSRHDIAAKFLNWR
jgi:hypothetical protein